jgi:hypothetical protein
MEVFIEQLVEKHAAAADNVKRAMIIAGALILLALLTFGSMMLSFPPLILIGAGVVYFAYIFLTGIGTEYEYILTGDELDIDKITGKRKRKRMVTLKLSGATAWAKGEAGNHIPEGAATVMAHSGLQDRLWHIIAKHENYGDVLLYFSPDPRTAYEINRVVPASVRIRDLPPYKSGDDHDQGE